MARLHLLSQLVIVLSISYCSLSQGPPRPQLRANAQAFLDAHNSARAQVGVQPLKWSAILESNTSLVFQNRSGLQSCSFAKLSGTAYGMNLIWTTGPLVSPQEAVTSWVAAKKYYNFAHNSCLLGQQCGGYPQVVWNESLELGCAQGLCADSALTICIYNPPGNTVGEKPY